MPRDEDGNWHFETPLDLQDYRTFHESIRPMVLPLEEYAEGSIGYPKGPGVSFLGSLCPYCGAEYIAEGDRYSLLLWHQKGVDFFRKDFGGGGKFFMRAHQLPGDEFWCPHYHGEAFFLNLRGQFPDLKANGIYGATEPDYNIFTNGPEVPFFNPLYCMDVPMTHKAAVIHSVPFYQIKDNQLVETYTLHVMTYFVGDYEVPQETPSAEDRARGVGMRSFQGFGEPYMWKQQAILPHILRMFDLEYWMEKGNVYWLDSTGPQSPQLRRDYHSWPQSQEPGRIFPLQAFYYPNGEVKGSHVVWNPRFNRTWTNRTFDKVTLNLKPPYRLDQETIHTYAQAGGADPKFPGRMCDEYPILESEIVDFENTRDWYTLTPERDSYRQKEHIPFKRGFFP